MMPPGRGNIDASSESDSARHSDSTPPRVQSSAIAPTESTLCATLLGTLKIPLPMVMPIDHRGRRSKARGGGANAMDSDRSCAALRGCAQ